MADPLSTDGPLSPGNGPRRPSGAEQWQQAIREQQQRELTKPSTGEQIGDIINRTIAGNPIMQAAQLYQNIYQGQLDPLSPEAAGRALWTAMSMAGAGMPYAQRGAVGITGGKPPGPPTIKTYTDALLLGKITPAEFEGFMDALGVEKAMSSRMRDSLMRQREELLGSVREQLLPDDRLSVLRKLATNRDWQPQVSEGRMVFKSLSPEENEVMNRIGWGRADNVTWENETSADDLTRARAWRDNIMHWLRLASPPEDKA